MYGVWQTGRHFSEQGLQPLSQRRQDFSLMSRRPVGPRKVDDADHIATAKRG